MSLPYHTPLTPEAQLAHGLDAPWPLAVADRVRFAELDRLNHVNNAAYMVWFESIRIRYMQDWGLTQYKPTDPRIVVRRAEIDYLAEMRMDEDYIVTARTSAFRTTSFTMVNQLWSGHLRATFSCVIVLLDPQTRARTPLPAPLIERFKTVDGASRD